MKSFVTRDTLMVKAIINPIVFSTLIGRTVTIC